MNTSTTLQKFLSIAMMKGYSLPGNPDKDTYMLGVSGGADSSVTAILMIALFPHVNWVLCYTDTQVEVEGTEESLAALQAFTGFDINRVNYHGSLFDVVAAQSKLTEEDDSKYFLPNSNSRYCTRILKLSAYERFVSSLRSKDDDFDVHSFIGLRADEPTRSGLDSDKPWLVSHYPMQELGIVRADVFAILTETIGVPTFYRNRGRSGCKGCFFQKQSEFIGLLQSDPKGFNEVMQYEKLSNIDTQRFIVSEGDLSALHVNYPIPSDIDLRTAHNSVDRRRDTVGLKRHKSDTLDMFSENMVDIYVGVEYFVDTMMANYYTPRTGTPGVWWQNLVGWSTAKHGITTKLKNHYWTRFDTCEVFGLTESNFNDQYRTAIFHLEVPSHMVDMGKSSDGTYSWKKDETMAQLKMVANIVKRTLLNASDMDNLEEYARFAGTDTWEGEQHAAYQQRVQQAQEAGKIINWFSNPAPTKRPKAPTGVDAPCFACSK